MNTSEHNDSRIISPASHGQCCEQILLFDWRKRGNSIVVHTTLICGEKHYVKAEDHSALWAELGKHIIFLATFKDVMAKNRWKYHRNATEWINPLYLLIYLSWLKCTQLVYQEGTSKENDSFMDKVTSDLSFYKENPYTYITISHWGLWHDWFEALVKHKTKPSCNI